MNPLKSLLILGRQPALGTAELESLYGADALVPISEDAIGLNLAPEDVDFTRLGGSIKLCKVLDTLDFDDWGSIQKSLLRSLPGCIQDIPKGKLKLGLSTYGLRARPAEINATGLELKKVIKQTGRSIRIVPNKSTELNSAQVIHNQLTGTTGIELVLVRSGRQTILAQTVAEQDIDAYAKRDQMRPMRDAKVGMLPPKLAQVLVNLAVGQIEENRNQKLEIRILDPFCGTGVLLQEALLMGYKAYGTDIEKRMVEYSEANLKWLETTHNLKPGMGQVEIGDATSYTWSHPIDVVAGETFLGKPLTSLPPRHVLDKVIAECDAIHEQFLRNIAEQLTPGTRLCLGVPAWKLSTPHSPLPTKFLHLKTLANLDKLGYTRKKFVHVRDQELIYHRPDQIVARELVILEKA